MYIYSGLTYSLCMKVFNFLLSNINPGNTSHECESILSVKKTTNCVYTIRMLVHNQTIKSMGCDIPLTTLFAFQNEFTVISTVKKNQLDHWTRLSGADLTSHGTGPIKKVTVCVVARHPSIPEGGRTIFD